jgi:agmatinase
MKMPDYPAQEPFNFLGLDSENYESAKIVVFPVPYGSTTYWKSGTKDGPAALLEASRHIEVYDQESKRNIESGIFTLPFLEPNKNSPKETVERIEAAMKQIIGDKKVPIMIGGEHSITLGAVTAFAKQSDDFSVLQIDAHSDLRDEFEGTKFHHATIMSRIKDLGVSTTQVGIRSFLKDDKFENVFFAPDLPVEKIIKTLKKNVYLTFDLDGLDPSIMPSTGTPEPGGLGWYETLNLLKEVAHQRNIIGADVVELDPIPGLHAPDFLAAKLVYKIISYIIK